MRIGQRVNNLLIIISIDKPRSLSQGQNRRLTLNGHLHTFNRILPKDIGRQVHHLAGNRIDGCPHNDAFFQARVDIKLLAVFLFVLFVFELHLLYEDTFD